MIGHETLYAREDALEQHMARLVELVDTYRGPDQAFGVELQLNRMVGAWRQTLGLRERFVYAPAAERPDTADAAAAGHQRTLELAEQVEDFARRWSSSALIATAFPRFRGTALLLIAAIRARIDGDRRLLGTPHTEGQAELLPERRAA